MTPPAGSVVLWTQITYTTLQSVPYSDLEILVIKDLIHTQHAKSCLQGSFSSEGQHSPCQPTTSLLQHHSKVHCSGLNCSVAKVPTGQRPAERRDLLKRSNAVIICDFSVIIGKVAAQGHPFAESPPFPLAHLGFKVTAGSGVERPHLEQAHHGG